MTYILEKRPLSLRIQAGAVAKQLITEQGLRAEQVDILPGAAGGPKGIGLQGLDQAIFDHFLAHVPKRRALIGSSIGSWRFASILAWGATEGTKRLAELYTHMHFEKHMTRQQISQVCNTMLRELIGGKEDQIIQHPDYHLAIMAVKSRHIFNSDHAVPLLASVAGIVGTNTFKRQATRVFMQRVVAQPARDELQLKLHRQKDFFTHYHTLSSNNLNHWLMASGSIPGLMAGVHDIPDTPGCYRDGGLIDYHLDLPYPSQGIVLYPHFSDHITPGWFDKFVKWRKANPENHARTLLISPSQSYLSRLPQGKLPDRKDFKFGVDQTARIRMWKQCVAESQRLGDDFLELIHKQNIEQYIEPLY